MSSSILSRIFSLCVGVSLLSGLQIPSSSASTRVEADFSQLVQRYTDAYQRETRSGSASRVLSTLYSTQIRNHVFQHVDSLQNETYINELTYLDEVGVSHAPAVFDLARKLQFHWESRYAAGIGQRAAQLRTNRDIGFKAGASVGMLALGVLLIKNPAKAPRYFRMVRHLLPASGAIAGRTAGASRSAIHVGGDAPPGPAHIMRLGLPAHSEEPGYGEDQLYQDFISLSAGMAAGSIATELWLVVRGARAINVAATPAKLHPLVLIGSLAVGLAVEEGVARGIEYWEEEELRKEMRNALTQLDRSIRENDQAGLLVDGERFKRSVMNLAMYLWKPIIEASSEFQEEALSISARYSVDSREFATRLERATRDYRDNVRSELSALDSYYDPAHENHVVLSYLRAHNSDAIRDLSSATARTRATQIASSFEAWLTQNEHSEGICFDGCRREAEFQNYLNDYQFSTQSRLAREFRADRGRSHPNHLLLQGAALLSTVSYGRDLLAPLADELLALVDNNDQVIAESGFGLGGL